MKINSILNKKIPLWVIGIILLVVAFLAIVGFRITYAPELENSWSAISAVASWAGVATTIAAIIVAIQIPQKIADNQNKIALFDKRYELYEKIMYFVSLSMLISQMGKDNLTARDIQFMFASSLVDSSEYTNMEDVLKYKKSAFFTDVLTVMQKTEPLFDFNIENELSAMIIPLMKIVYETSNQTGIEEISKFVEAVGQVEANILPKIKKTLELGKQY